MTTQRLLPVLAAGSLALALAGCATDDSTDATLSDVSPTTTQAADAESGAPAPADQQTPDANPADPGQAQPDRGTTDQSTTNGTCATEQLDIGLSNEQGAAGSRLADVTFTNTSSEPCTLNGFPGVSAVTNNDGTQLGAAAERESGQETTTITLAPGHSARAGLKMTNVGVLDPASCQPQAADGLRVYPPGETASAFIRISGLEGCAGDANYLSIQPVTAG